LIEFEITITGSGCRGKLAANPNANRYPVTTSYPNHPAVAWWPHRRVSVPGCFLFTGRSCFYALFVYDLIF